MGIKLCLLQECAAAVYNMTCICFLAGMYFLMFAEVGEDFEGGVTSRTRVGALIRVGQSMALKVRLSHKTLVTTRLCTDERALSWGDVSLGLQSCSVKKKKLLWREADRSPTEWYHWVGFSYRPIN